ncbi:MAG: histidine--tRNA ligase [Rhodomicrobium sp.]|nr:histidine--tRNA ligase [Rhodomicrobium sp.]
MSSKKREQRPEARLPKGMRDIEAAEIRGVERMLRTIREVYESYGFEPLDTPAFEYTDALGKFLPDQDRPNEGVFSFQDEDDEWLSLRYDLTAPLARYVAQNFDGLPKPFRRYQTGPVWRNEKPGPGRFRQFTQFDADTVGTDSVAADAEMCMLAADTLEALGIPRGNYAINISNRKILDGLLEIIGLNPSADESIRVRNAVLRALDKLDKFPPEEIELLLGVGRLDESGDFTKGAGLASNQIKTLLNFVYKAREHFEPREQMRERGKLRTEDELVDENDWVLDVTSMLADWSKQLQSSAIGSEGVEELRQMQEIWWCSGYGSNRIRPNANIVRGLEYYTGPIFEADLGFETIDSAGKNARFGSVGGGGRYDGLVSRFKGTKIPATGFSIGVSRLYAALQALGKLKTDAAAGPVVVLVMDKERVADYNRMARALREAGIRAEMYLGTSGMKAQMKYADKRGAPCVVIQGGDEREHPDGPRVTIKDLIEGERLAAEISDNQEWREGRPAQFSVKEGELVEAVRSVLARHGK